MFLNNMLPKSIAKLLLFSVLAILIASEARGGHLLQIFKISSAEVTFEKPFDTPKKCDKVKHLVINFQKSIEVESSFIVSCKVIPFDNGSYTGFSQ